MIDEIVRAELEHWQRDPGWLREAERLGSAGPIVIEREIDIGHMAGDTFTNAPQLIAASALPAGRFALRSSSELQADADRSGRETYFVVIDITSFAGRPDLFVGFQVRMVQPHKSGPMSCCCGATDLFATHDGHWTLTKRRSIACP